MQANLTAQSRSDFGKERMKKLRRDGMVPAVIYGADQQPEHVVIVYHDLDVLTKKTHGQTVLVSLDVTDEKGDKHSEKVFVRDLQRDPVTEKILHADLLRVDLKKPVVIEVAVVAVGIPEGVKMGGLLETLSRSVSIRCLPENVLPHLDVDVSKVQINESLHVGDIAWPEGVEVLTDDETALFTVLGKRGVEDEEVAAPETEGAAEPEVIGKKKKEEEEGDEG